MLHTKPDRKHRNEAGFTLLEVMISAVVLSIGLLAIGIMQIASIDGDSKAKEMTEAGTLAMDQLESLLAMDYDSINDQNVTNGKYTISIDVTENNEDTMKDTDAGNDVPGLGVDVKLVVMTVAWQSKYEDGVKNKTFSMRHVIPKIDK